MLEISFYIIFDKYSLPNTFFDFFTFVFSFITFFILHLYIFCIYVCTFTKFIYVYIYIYINIYIYICIPYWYSPLVFPRPGPFSSETLCPYSGHWWLGLFSPDPDANAWSQQLEPSFLLAKGFLNYNVTINVCICM